MRILEYGNRNDSTIILAHGFESPYQIWNDDIEEQSEFISFDAAAKEIEDYCASRSIDHVNEIIFRKTANYIRKNYAHAMTVCLKGKGHCEDALLHSQEWIKQLDNYIDEPVEEDVK